jgi:propionyl-CoA carboxylase alpha chain
LPITQDQITLAGSAIEARVYAEDPLRGFLPSIERLRCYRPPAGEGIRIDTGVCEGAEISIYLIAKLVVYGATRREAIQRMSTALDRFVIRGVNHNIGFLAAIMRRPRFLLGEVSTDFVTTEFPDGVYALALCDEDLKLLVTIAAAVHRKIVASERPAPSIAFDRAVLIGQPPYVVRNVVVTGIDDQNTAVIVNGRSRIARTSWQPGQLTWEGTVDSAPMVVRLDRKGVGWRLWYAGAFVECESWRAVQERWRR